MERSDLDAIEERLEAATPGPWGYENIGEKENCYAVGTAWRYDDAECRQVGGPIERYDESGDEVLYVEAVCFCKDGSLSAGGTLHGNAKLIAHSPTDIRALLTYCRYLKELLSDLATELSESQTRCRELEAENQKLKDQVSDLAAALTDAQEQLADQAAM